MKKITTVACAVAVIGAFSVGTTTASAAVTVPNLATYCAKISNPKAKANCQAAATRVQALISAALAKKSSLNTTTTVTSLTSQFQSLLSKYSSQLTSLGGLNSLISQYSSQLTSLSGLNLSSLNLGGLNLSNLSGLLSGFKL